MKRQSIFHSWWFTWAELILPCTFWREAYWRALCPNKMDEAQESCRGNRQWREGWRGRKCAARSDSSTFTVQVKVSAACQFDYQMAPAALEKMTCYIFSDVCTVWVPLLLLVVSFLLKWGAMRIIVQSVCLIYSYYHLPESEVQYSIGTWFDLKWWM